MEIFDQPLSLWLVLASLILLVFCLATVLRKFSAKSMSSKILASLSVAFGTVALILLAIPLNVDGMTCGISAGALGWGPESEHLREGNVCIALQEQVFAIAVAIQIIGIALAITTLVLTRAQPQKSLSV